MDEIEETQPKDDQMKKVLMIIGAIVVIGIIGFAVMFFIIGIRFDIIDTPFNTGSNQKINMLVVGATSQEVIDILNQNRDMLDYDLKTTQDLERNPREIIANYNIVMLDQSNDASKEVTKKFGEAIETYVKSGGSFILVKDSGIRRPDTYDVVGWENTFGDIIPVKCHKELNSQPSCTNRIIVRGKLYRQDEDHSIMEGIDMFPADQTMNATFETFDIALDGKEIAYIQSRVGGKDGKEFVGIAEKNLVFGKSIYFNYSPGKTRGIFESTLQYLK